MQSRQTAYRGKEWRKRRKGREEDWFEGTKRRFSLFFFLLISLLLHLSEEGVNWLLFRVLLPYLLWPNTGKYSSIYSQKSFLVQWSTPLPLTQIEWERVRWIKGLFWQPLGDRWNSERWWYIWKNGKKEVDHISAPSLPPPLSTLCHLSIRLFVSVIVCVF